MKYMILSVDTGIDDALALAYAVGQEQLSLLGVTVSYGMAPLEKTYRNTIHTLKLLGAGHIPVYPGSRVPLKELRTYDGHFHGMDGAANLLGEPKEEELPPKYAKDAVSFILECIKKYGQELILVTTGPLTDLAIAIQREPDTLKNIGKVIAMGGALACPGNSSPYAEANIKADSAASHIVVTASLPLTLVGLDVTRKTLLTEEDIQAWNHYHTPAAQYFYKLLSFYIKEYQHFYPYLDGCALHDPLAVAAACHPDLIETLPFNVAVIQEGQDKGRLTENIYNIHALENTQIALKVNHNKFKKLFMNIMEKTLSNNLEAQVHAPAANVYIAGPMLFYPDGAFQIARYKDICTQLGFSLPQGITPILDSDSPATRAIKHRMRCIESLDNCDYVLANLTPFRGNQPDSGTLFEAGYACATGKQCYFFIESLKDRPCFTAKLPDFTAAAITLAQSIGHMPVIDLSFPEGSYEPDAFSSFLCGYMFGQGIPYTVITDDLRPLKEKLNGTFSQERGCWVDAWQNMIEDFDLPFNLMIATTAQAILPKQADEK